MKLHSLLRLTFKWDFGVQTPTKFNPDILFPAFLVTLDAWIYWPIFRDVTKDLNPSKFYQISMYGPNTNLKFFNEYSNKFTETTHHSLINIWTFNLYVIHGSLQTGESASWCGLKNMEIAHRIIHNNIPARRKDYTSVTGSLIYIFNFCTTKYSLLQTIYCFTNLIDLEYSIIFEQKKHSQKSMYGQTS